MWIDDCVTFFLLICHASVTIAADLKIGSAILVNRVSLRCNNTTEFWQISIGVQKGFHMGKRFFFLRLIATGVAARRHFAYTVIDDRIIWLDYNFNLRKKRKDGCYFNTHIYVYIYIYICVCIYARFLIICHNNTLLFLFIFIIITYVHNNLSLSLLSCHIIFYCNLLL